MIFHQIPNFWIRILFFIKVTGGIFNIFSSGKTMFSKNKLILNKVKQGELGCDGR